MLALYVPLTAFSFPAAKVIWLVLQLSLLGYSLWLLARLTAPGTGLGLAGRSDPAGDGLGDRRSQSECRPAQHAILALLALGLTCLERGKQSWAGMFFAAAALYKPVPLILFVGLLLRRRWEALLAGLIALAIGGLASIALFGPQIHLSFLSVTLGSPTKLLNLWWSFQSLSALFGRLLTENRYSTPWVDAPTALPRLLWLLSSGALVGAAAWVTIRQRAPELTNLSLWLVAGLLISPRILDSYLIWSWIPLAVLLREAMDARRWVVLALLGLDYALLDLPGTVLVAVSPVPPRVAAAADELADLGPPAPIRPASAGSSPGPDP